MKDLASEGVKRTTSSLSTKVHADKENYQTDLVDGDELETKEHPDGKETGDEKSGLDQYGGSTCTQDRNASIQHRLLFKIFPEPSSTPQPQHDPSCSSFAYTTSVLHPGTPIHHRSASTSRP